MAEIFEKISAYTHLPKVHETPQKGYDKGSFIIIKAIKKLRGSHPEKLSQDEIKRNLTMIVIDKDAT